LQETGKLFQAGWRSLCVQVLIARLCSVLACLVIAALRLLTKNNNLGDDCALRYEHPDSFRFAEALEAGCLPLVASCEAGPLPPDSSPGPSPGPSPSRGAYFRAYARYAHAAFGAPALSDLGCAPVGVDGGNNTTWSCPTAPAALLWHPGGGGGGRDWPALAAAAAASLEELRRGEYAR
jgi:hypothetical protein